jgi:hypothetical protein
MGQREFLVYMVEKETGEENPICELLHLALEPPPLLLLYIIPHLSHNLVA